MSPDGQTVTFNSDTGLFAVDADGSDVRMLVSPRLKVSIKHDWSPEGNRIMFTPFYDFEQNPNVWTIGTDGTGVDKVTHATGSRAAVAGSFSPDGEQIVFRRENLDGGRFPILTMNADGSDRTLIVVCRSNRGSWTGVRMARWRRSPTSRTPAERSFGAGPAQDEGYPHAGLRASEGAPRWAQSSSRPSVDATDERRCRTMQMNPITRHAVGAVLAALMIAVAGCTGSGSDKAGGAEKPEPIVLTFASFTEPVPQPLQVFAEEVVRRSNGTMRIGFKWPWRPGDPNAEHGTIEDVEAGKVDMAWVGARVFDTLDVTSFQGLLAPLLVDTYDLQEKVFASGIPTSMLDGVEKLGVVGIGVLPGQMRKLLGVSHPFLEPSDFEGEVIGGAENELSLRTFQALGATLEALPAGGSLAGLDATEQHLGAIWGNHYNKSAKYVGANVNLWPRPLVIFAGNEFFESLAPNQQAVLREAAAAVVPGALAAARAEDEEAALQLCRHGVTFAVASESDLGALRGALEPVYAELTSDPETRP